VIVEVPGASLWTDSQGAGLPLVLSHGGPGLSDNLGPVAEMVDDLALVHRYDQRGSGRSRSDGPFDVASFVADLEALRRHWGHERWLVGGHSWGANLALCYAVAHPDRTSGVIYLAGSGLRPGGWEAARRLRLGRLTDEEREELATAGTDRFLQLMGTTDFADRPVAARVLEAGPLYRWPRDENIFRAVIGSFQEVIDRLDDKVRRLDVPLLVIHGAHDEPARAREVAELAPQGRFVELEHSAHVPWFEEPARLRELLRAFIREPFGKKL
jgi:proline iminopeptidase